MPSAKIYTKKNLHTPEAQAQIEAFITNVLPNCPNQTCFQIGGVPGYAFSNDLCLVKRPSRKPGEFRYDIFSLNDELGKGAFGAIYAVALEAKIINGRFLYRIPPKVVKFINKPEELDNNTWRVEVSTETFIFQAAHKGKAHLAIDGDAASIVMKDLGGDLDKLLKNDRRDFKRRMNIAAGILNGAERATAEQAISSSRFLNFAERVIIANRTVDALMQFHALNYIHSDLKPPNVMVSRERKEVGLTDFGLTAQSHTRRVPHGSPLYAPTEMFKDVFQHRASAGDGLFEYTIAVDQYALAGTLAELFDATDPFKDKIHKDESGDETLNLAPYCFDGLLDNVAGAAPYKDDILAMLEGLSDVDPAKRTDLAEVKKRLDGIELGCLRISTRELEKCINSMQNEVINNKKSPGGWKRTFMQNISGLLASALNDIKDKDNLTWESYENAYSKVKTCVWNMDYKKKMLGHFRVMSFKSVFNTLTRPISCLLGWACENEKWLNQGFVDTTSLTIAANVKQHLSSFQQKFFKTYSSQANFKPQNNPVNRQKM